MIEIDVTGTDVLSLRDACKLLPAGRNGARTHLSTLLRWIERGAIAPNGERTRLAAVRFGGRWLTSKAALQAFAEALTPRPEGETAPKTVRQRRRAEEEVAAVLDAAGI